ncbi:MAG: 30S ribosomal protein S12 methylthiotransferase RimO [Chloroflexi bacterium]|nr:30S ribosomal protein S12 methylthiotransferase RimO [Chloroflexota bacterium]MBU1747926.1 30S ribosomal protein S12 methylthiotransferase RimO [Chloroflexota bacterium]MBU1879238.1 30S ribosomal protein S12 methylthiotransferase RimO [Chloroflexota bacterium]
MRYYILTLGCPKNDVDSEGMGQLLNAAGHAPVADPAWADVLIVNTCGFIDPARDESLAALSELAAAKSPCQRLIAAGCLAELGGDALRAAVPGVDAVLSTRRSHDIVDMVEGRPGASRSPLSASRIATTPSAYLQIADGCDGPCAFCLIPRIKGPYRSKPKVAILQEAQALADQGVQEIVLIAQDTTAYGLDRGETDGLARLLETLIAQTPAVRWWRIMYAYPQRITPRLIKAMATLPPVCHYLDLPLQHAHPDTLRRMGRPADVDRVRRVIGDLRASMPDIALRTTFIVGYPGETRREFRALVDFLHEMQFDHVGVFPFWPQEGTPAAALPDQVPQQIREDRYHRLMQDQQIISQSCNQTQVGRTLPVLVEGLAEVEDDLEPLIVGRCYRDAPEIDGLVWVQGAAEPGRWITAHITAATEYDLWGVMSST